MKRIEIKLDDTRILIGDIWVDVDIEFKPVIMPIETMEKIEIDRINSQLNVLSFEIGAEIKKLVNARLDSQTKQDESLKGQMGEK